MTSCILHLKKRQLPLMKRNYKMKRESNTDFTKKLDHFTH